MAAFLREAMHVCVTQIETRSARHLLSLISERGLLSRFLCLPGLDKNRALCLARATASVAPSADIQIARSLAGMLDAPETTDTIQHISRLMDILSEISDAGRLFPSIVRLLRHPNPHIRSKAVLMIGRQSRSAQWVRHRLADADSRIRANALESLWDVDTVEARQLLEKLIRDPNNRVAGNALLGLYRLGDTRVISEILNLSTHDSAPFRATTAWVMGETGDPRFTEVLAALMREPNPVVRKRAFSALGQLRATAARGIHSPQCRLAVRSIESLAGSCRLSLAVAGSNGGSAPNLLPTQFILSEDTRVVQSYRATNRPLPETLFVVFLMPMKGRLEVWREAALACLPWKRPSDLWACDFYHGAASRARAKEAENGAQGGPPAFQASGDSIRADFSRSTQCYDSSDLWIALRRLTDLEDGVGVANCQFIVFREDICGSPPPDDLPSALAAAQANVHVVSTAPDPVLEEFCRKSNGIFALTGSSPPEAAIRTYIHLLPQYEITWQPTSAVRQLKIRLHGPASGEIALPMPGGRAMIEL